MLKQLAVLTAICCTAAASIKQVEITGTVFEETGTFFGFTGTVPFTLTLQYDTEAEDWIASDPTIGEYFSDLPISLDLPDAHFAGIGTRVTVNTDSSGLNRGFIFWNDEEIIGSNGYQVPENGIYIQFLCFDPSRVTNDSLSSVQPYDISDFRSTERFYLINDAYPDGDGASRLLSDSETGIQTFSIRDVPEPTPETLALFTGMLFFFSLSGRSAKRRATT